MDEPLKHCQAAMVRGLIAERYLNLQTGAAARRGGIELRPHQLEAVSRLRELLESRRCALLADDVGLGKTYVAATIATEASHTLLLAPAGLCAMWEDAVVRVGAHRVHVVSHESMSRDPDLDIDYDLIVVDEAHHFRTPATRRYARLADIVSDAPLLLISATPVHNSERDLRSLFALALGSRAFRMPLGDLLNAVVRRRHDAIGSEAMPIAEPPVWLPLPDDAHTLDLILDLPPPLPPADGGDADALVIHGLARQWASSDHALMRALTRRRAAALSLISALEQGRYPSRSELRSWAHAEDCLQLGFPELLASPHPNADALLAVVKEHEGAVAGLLRTMRNRQSADDARAAHLLKLRRKHPGARIVAFTQFADTARGLYRRIVATGRVAVLTARGATTAGGAMSRREALERFCPSTARGRTAAAAEEIDLLVTTDLLSEGIDLPDVSVVVHLDLPWTPARLEQRVGRALRLTSRHQRIAVYCMAAPASSETLVRSEVILRRKLQEAVRSVGITGTILPASTPAVPAPQPALSEAREAIRTTLRAWRTSGPFEAQEAVIVGSVRSAKRGWIALVEHETGDRELVIAGEDRVLPQDDARLQVLDAASGTDTLISPHDLDSALLMLAEWLQHRRGAESAAISITPGARAGTLLLRRIGKIAGRAPAHRRTALSDLAIRARRAVLAPRGIAVERVLASLADANMTDEAWLRALAAFGDANSDDRGKALGPAHGRVLALLLLQEA